MKNIQIIQTNTTNPKVKELVKLLDAELWTIYGNSQEAYETYNDVSEGISAVLVELDGQSIGCGAFKKYDEQSAELKRVFILPIHRGKGISKLIVSALENWMCSDGIDYGRLETGPLQPIAINLYKKLGYEIIENYPPYENMGDRSVCMMKKF